MLTCGESRRRMRYVLWSYKFSQMCTCTSGSIRFNHHQLVIRSNTHLAETRTYNLFIGDYGVQYSN